MHVLLRNRYDNKKDTSEERPLGQQKSPQIPICDIQINITTMYRSLTTQNLNDPN